MSEFFWIANHRGLDLLNTAAADDDGEPVELLDRFEALTSWLDAAELVDVADVQALSENQQQHLLRWTRDLRNAGRRVIDHDDPLHSSGVPDLDALAAEVCVRLAYVPTADTRPLPLTAGSGFDRIRLALALAVLEATRLDRSRLRRCAREGCVLLFFDTSKNRTRRWCDMAVCGNRVKAASHYRRHHVSDR